MGSTACAFGRAGQGLRDTAHRVVCVWPRGCIWLGVADPVTVWGSLCVSLCVMVCVACSVCVVCVCVHGHSVWECGASIVRVGVGVWAPGEHVCVCVGECVRV